MQSLKDQFALMLAAKDNEIAALKARNGEDQGDSHGTTNPGRPVPEGMAPEDRIKQLEQQKNKYAIDAYGQGTESEKYNHGCQDPVKADDLVRILLRQMIWISKAWTSPMSAVWRLLSK